MTEILIINNVRIQKCQSPLMKKVSAVVDDTNMLSVLCPEGTTDEEVIEYVRVNFPHIIFADDEEVEVMEELDEPVEEVDSEEQRFLNMVEDMVRKREAKLFPVMRGQELFLEYFDEINKILLKGTLHIGDRTFVIAKGPRSTSPNDAEFFLLNLALKNGSGSLACKTPCEPGYVGDVEGYEVYWRTPYHKQYSPSAVVFRYQGKVFINVNGPDYLNSKESILDYVRQRLEHIISTDSEHVKTYAGHDHKGVWIDKSSYTNVNRRKDIIDDDPVKVMKHKLKTSVISPTYSSPLSGEKKIPLNGTWVINYEGRLIRFDFEEDKFREQD